MSYRILEPLLILIKKIKNSECTFGVFLFSKYHNIYLYYTENGTNFNIS